MKPLYIAATLFVLTYLVIIYIADLNSTYLPTFDCTPDLPLPDQTGKASYYSTGFHGRLTASGEVYDSLAYTCAHKTLPFGTRVLIENNATHAIVEVTVTDRGPFVPGRIVDLSYRAAEEIGMIRAGVQDVNLYTVSLNTK